jgi:hypothetical protein
MNQGRRDDFVNFNVFDSSPMQEQETECQRIASRCRVQLPLQSQCSSFVIASANGLSSMQDLRIPSQSSRKTRARCVSELHEANQNRRICAASRVFRHSPRATCACMTATIQIPGQYVAQRHSGLVHSNRILSICVTSWRPSPTHQSPRKSVRRARIPWR